MREGTIELKVSSLNDNSCLTRYWRTDSFIFLTSYFLLGSVVPVLGL